MENKKKLDFHSDFRQSEEVGTKSHFPSMAQDAFEMARLVGLRWRQYEYGSWYLFNKGMVWVKDYVIDFTETNFALECDRVKS